MAAGQRRGRLRPLRGGLWRQRDFALFWTGETTSEVGSAITMIALPLVAVQTLHASTFAVTVVNAAIWLPWPVIGIPAGAWVDRLSPRMVMLICDLVSLTAFASVPAAAWAGVLSVAQLIAVALISGTASIFFRTAYQVLLPGIVDEADLTEGNAKLMGSRAAAQVSGPGLGGVIAQLAGPAIGLLADAVSFAVSFVCLTAIRRPPTRRQAPVDSGASRTQDALRGLRLVWGDPYLRVMTVFGATANLAFSGLDSLIVVFLVRTVGLPAGIVGLILAAYGAGGVLGALAARPFGRRVGTSRAVLISTVGCMPFALLLPLTGTGPAVAFGVIAHVVLGAGLVSFSIITASFRQSYVPPDTLGRVSSVVMTMSFTSMPVGSLLAGLLATTLGIRPAMWIITAGAAAAGLILLSPMRQVRDLPTRAESPALSGAPGPH